MEGITHRSLAVNGITMHVAEMGGAGRPVVLLLHGFPELWYSWRHQIVGLAGLGYRAVAPDLRGYGGTDAPKDVGSYTMCHIVGDLVALIGALGQDKVFVVGHDWGATVAWTLCAMRPDLVRALVNTSVAHFPRNPLRKPVETLRAALGDDLYICAFQEHGRAESMFASMSVEELMKKFLAYHDPSPPSLPIFLSNHAATPLPDWLSEEDIKYYGEIFAKTGFTGGLNYYRAIDLNWEIMAPWSSAKIMVPAKFIIGDEDLTYHMPGTQLYLQSGGFKANVPLLEDVVVLKGAGHFIQQEKPEEITDHIYQFIKKF